MLPFWIALQFLSSLPVRLAGMPGPAALGRSLLWYPAVGLLFGLILAWLQWLLGAVAPMLQAALLLGAWVLLSGALHLDGLADSADAWLGGFGDRARTLEIMKDPRSGPLAVVTLIVVLLLKFSALLVLVERGQGALLVAVPVIGRTAVLGLFLSTPYVRPGGLGQALADHLPRPAGRWVVGLTALALWGGFGDPLLWMLGMAAVVFYSVRRMLLRRLGGTTGDTAGALLELVEVAALLAVAVR